MADYDVEVRSLAVPTPSAPATTYRPAVYVRNNGVHDSLATGILRIYAAGRMVFSSPLYSDSIPPGETHLAQTELYWEATPGTYTIIADATTPHDQVEPNNHLPPVQIVITSEPAPPTPPVTLHASQHEEGGQDEVSIDGLAGLARTAQTPRQHGNDAHDQEYVDATAANAIAVEVVGTHNGTTAPHPGTTNLEYVEHKGAAGGYASLDEDGTVPVDQLPEVTPTTHAITHQTGGNDEISIAGLNGEAADPQPPKAHKADHQANGTDELNLEGMSGELSTPQTPKGHHTTHESGGSDEIAGIPPATHDNDVHTTTQDEPKRAHAEDKGTPGSSKAVARADHRHMGSGLIAAAYQNQFGTEETLLLTLDTTTSITFTGYDMIELSVAILADSFINPGTLTLRLKAGVDVQNLSILETLALDFAPGSDWTASATFRLGARRSLGQIVHAGFATISAPNSGNGTTGDGDSYTPTPQSPLVIVLTGEVQSAVGHDVEAIGVWAVKLISADPNQ